jgi:predicted PurR-regulated permease PerM
LPPVEELGARISDLLRSAGAVIARQAGAVLGAMLVLILDLAVLVLALYFCFRDGPALASRARRLLPFDADASARITRHLHDLIHASVTSGVIVAAVQGLLGGLTFALLGIQGAIFWGVVMGFLSLLPLVGSWLVWLPVALWLLATDHVTKGIILIVLGAVLVGGVDNVLRPLLIGKRSSLSILLLFIGLLGGVSAFGFIGLVLGPVVIALALAVYQAQIADEPGDAPGPAAG